VAFARTGCGASLICRRSFIPIIITTNLGLWAAIISSAARGQSGYLPRGSFRASVRISPDEVAAPPHDADFRGVGVSLLETIGEPVRHRFAEQHDRHLRDRIGLLGRGPLE
jgi:hypothetical protein